MSHIATVHEAEATGAVQRLYRAARKRAGRVFAIVRLMSPNPPVLEASIGLYQAIMKGPSQLSTAERELVATVVSRTNGCHY